MKTNLKKRVDQLEQQMGPAARCPTWGELLQRAGYIGADGHVLPVTVDQVIALCADLERRDGVTSILTGHDGLVLDVHGDPLGRVFLRYPDNGRRPPSARQRIEEDRQ